MFAAGMSGVLVTLGIVGGFLTSVVGAYALALKLGPERQKLTAEAHVEEATAAQLGMAGLQTQIDMWKKMLDDRSAEMSNQLGMVREEMLRAKEEAANARTEAAKSRESAASAYTLQAQAEARLAEAERRHSEERHTLRNQIVEGEAKRVMLEARVRELENEVQRLTGVVAGRREGDRGPAGARGPVGATGDRGPAGPPAV